ncbi:MAG: bifunctional (p)ppGpp synthetase/guanosine-3',5'-bis(diphosphate) 3'-pyrophosphohydrolase [Bacteroidales bacterium]|nr:bifunctional (p)ppGpp synthetase/guanosine-3',5'-bis(diphosphate) 3'-pyrophosphohydrolase [Bacteroidales bacterium]
MRIKEENKKKIGKEHQKLLNSCNKVFSKGDIILINKAIDIVYYNCDANKSDKKNLNNAIAVAQIVIDEIGLGPVSVISALLFNINDDENLFKEIKNEFGKQVISIIKGLKKLSNLDTKNLSLNSENFIKLLLTLSDDVRVIIIKLAERLHTIRHIEYFQSGAKQKIASEILFLYSPIAHRLGLYNIKTEFEELSMKNSEPEIYINIAQKFKETKSKRNALIRKLITPIKKELEKSGYECEIKGRPKSIYSIWNKMKKQKVTFEEVYDLFAIRITLKNSLENEKADCWNIYSIVTNIYQPNPHRLRDWITTPKASGYESLHTTVIDTDGKWVEIQIRTKRMDEIAEKGVASHWKYKETRKTDKQDEWLGKIRKILENTKEKHLDNISDSKIELYKNEIFIFTPNGDIKKLPTGATLLDFAYSIHSDIGSKCTSGKINGKIIPLKYILKNGDKIEIITSKNQKPKRDWLNFVITNRAKAKIKRFIKEEKYKKSDEGKEILKKKLNQIKIEFSDENILKLLHYFKLKNVLDLYQMIAINKIELSEIKEFFITGKKIEEVNITEKTETKKVEEYIKKPIKNKHDYLIIDKNLDNIYYKLAKCCNPIYGDKVFGFVTVGQGTKIHRINCPNAKNLTEKYPYRILKVKWVETSKSTSYLTEIHISGIDKMGIVNSITKVISSDLQVEMRSISVDSKDGVFNGKISVFVQDTGHLDILLRNLLKIKGILNAKRLDNN